MEKEEGGAFWIRMEEEEEEGWGTSKPSIGFTRQLGLKDNDQKEVQGPTPPSKFPSEVGELLRSLALERQKILDDPKLSARHKRILLDENRKALTVTTGGRVTKTDSVVYGILIFGGLVLVVLALLTTFANLPSEVTLSFVGTVLGGTIATIAQKLGKL